MQNKELILDALSLEIKYIERRDQNHRINISHCKFFEIVINFLRTIRLVPYNK